MKPVFDENGLATVPGDMRCFYYNAVTYEYTGWSDEYINTGVSIPACSTGIDPGENIPGKVAVFTGKGWSHEEDHRNETVYSTENGAAVTVDYIGAIKDGYVTLSPLTPYDKWDGEKWVTDTEAQHSAAVEAAEAQRQSLIDAAMASISLIQLKLQAGRKLTQPENTRLNAVLDYIDAVTATDTSTAPDVIWPELPEAQAIQYLAHRKYRPVPVRPDNPATNYIAPVPHLSAGQQPLYQAIVYCSYNRWPD